MGGLAESVISTGVDRRDEATRTDSGAGFSGLEVAGRLSETASKWVDATLLAVTPEERQARTSANRHKLDAEVARILD